MSSETAPSEAVSPEGGEATFAELLRPELAELAAYVPAAGDFRVRLDANEAPPLLGAAARERLAQAARDVAWERYPDARTQALRDAIARHMSVTAEEVLVGVGSDELISLLTTTVVRPRGKSPVATVMTTTPTFVMYRMSARVRGLRVLEVPLDAHWDLSLPALERAVQMSEPNVVFIASPNNPTGNAMSYDRLAQLVELCRGSLVVIDEAYVAYAERDALELYRANEHVAILRTLSKVGFAALRVGWLVARPWVIREIDKARLPYNVPTPSQTLGRVVLDELSSDVAALVGCVTAERARLAAALAEVPRIVLTPSQANFLWLRSERPAEEVQRGLAERGVLVRSFHARGGRLTQQLRVTIGTREENDAFLGALVEVA